MKYRRNKVIYALNVADVQTVSSRVLNRELTDKEIALVEDSLGDFIDWFQAIQHAILNNSIKELRN